MKFRKKPVIIEATQWFEHGDEPSVRRVKKNFIMGQCTYCKKLFSEHGLVNTLEGLNHVVCPGDWIITGVKGEKYSCKPDIFEETYEPV